MNNSSRLARLRANFKKHKCDALFISDLTNVRYLTGYTGSAGLVVVTRHQAHFITDFRYKSQAAEQVSDDFKIHIADKGLWKQAAKALHRAAKKHHVKHLGFEAEHTSVALWEDAQKLLKAFDGVSTRRAVEGLRLHKDAEELATIRRAVEIVDEAFEHILGVLKPGVAERDISDELLHQMKLRGASGPSFEFIVASGPRGALPHGVASERLIGKNEMVTIDMGAVYEGYCSDCTRTVCAGKASKEQKKIYSLVWDAQVAASEALKPGLKCMDADRVARDIITEGGHEKAFGHGLGHGVGLEIHEAPRLSRLGKGKLEAGMVVTCEPGIYLDGWGGVRIEDMCFVTQDGAETLTRAQKPREILEV